MDNCDVLIVGGGPAGSSCAWALRESGLDVLIVDRTGFPREKLCGGWITPLVLQQLNIDTTVYENDHTLQPITGFRIGVIDDGDVRVDCHRIVSFGIRRCEFDDYLLRRSGARVREVYAVHSIERSEGEWVINGEIRAHMLVGAGGHFCPVTRLTSPRSEQQAVVAREIEFQMSAEEAEACEFRGDTPELYFCRDMKGYGWCFRKGDYLNIGLGRLDPHHLPEHVDHFVEFLARKRNLHVERELQFSGHAYFLFGHSERKVVDDGLVLIGDAAGLAYAQSGEGIRPAVESGLMAAQAIVDAAGTYSRANLQCYSAALHDRYASADGPLGTVAQLVPAVFRNAAARCLLRRKSFAQFVVDKWFLREQDAPVPCNPTPTRFL